MNTLIIKILSENPGIKSPAPLFKRLDAKTAHLRYCVLELEKYGYVTLAKNHKNMDFYSKIALTAKGHAAAMSNKNVDNLAIKEQVTLYKNCFFKPLSHAKA